MKKLLDFDETKGKTVKAIHRAWDYNDIIAIEFEDGDYLVMFGRNGYDGYASVETYDRPFDPMAMMRIGLITEAEKDAMIAEKERVREEQHQKHQKQEWERLRKIYGNE